MSVSYIYHKGKKIMFIDYTNCQTTEDTLAVLEMVKNEYAKTTESFLALSDFTGVIANNEYMEQAKKYSKLYFDARSIKSACLGITGVKKVLLSAYNLMTKNKQTPFDSKAEALDYLVK